MSDELSSAEATARELREQIAALVHARARAESEARRLGDRAVSAGADPSLGDVAKRWQRQAEVLAGEVESLRSSLRAAEARIEQLRADEAGA